MFLLYLKRFIRYWGIHWLLCPIQIKQSNFLLCTLNTEKYYKKGIVCIILKISIYEPTRFIMNLLEVIKINVELNTPCLYHAHSIHGTFRYLIILFSLNFIKVGKYALLEHPVCRFRFGGSANHVARRKTKSKVTIKGLICRW